MKLLYGIDSIVADNGRLYIFLDRNQKDILKHISSYGNYKLIFQDDEDPTLEDDEQE